MAEYTGGVSPNQCTGDNQRRVVSGTDDASMGRKRLLLDDVEGRFPWLEATLRALAGTGLEDNDDPLSCALVDILEDRLCPTDLHSGKPNDEWALAEGLAIYLRSGVLYRKFNPGIADSVVVADKKKPKKNEVR